MSGKGEGAFRTIGEVAESLDLPQHVLRFWETRFAEIEPVKRAGGRRYYRPRDVELVAAIRHLLYGQGYTIKGVQRILKEQGVRAVIDSARGGARILDIPEPSFRGVRDEEPPSPAAERSEREVALVLEDTIVSPPPAALATSPGTSLVALSPLRPQKTLTLPAVRISESALGLGAEDRRRLRDALEDLAESRRMLELTRRWER